MILYFLMIKLAALLGNEKARLLVQGQKDSLQRLQQEDWAGQWIWFHVASVGEFEQARPILERLKERKDPRKVLLTFFSPSGYELRKNYHHADRVLYLPVATRRNAKQFVQTVHPQMAVFVKYEFWPAYLKQLKKNGVTTYLISAIFRKNQLFFKPWGRSYRRLLTYFTHLYVQDNDSQVLLNRYHIHNVTTAGDTRFDRVVQIASQAKEIPVVQAFVHNQPKVLIAGSTWPEDEVLLARYMQERGDVKLVLVPHEIDSEHLDKIFQIMQGRYIRFSEANQKNIQCTRTLVMDTMGMLSAVYRYGHVAYIGGGFGDGIHNTLEAAVYGMPVIFGPRYHAFREALGLIQAGGARSIRHYRQFRDAMDEAFERHSEMGIAAKGYVASELGASEQILQAIFAY